MRKKKLHINISKSTTLLYFCDILKKLLYLINSAVIPDTEKQKTRKKSQINLTVNNEIGLI